MQVFFYALGSIATIITLITGLNKGLFGLVFFAISPYLFTFYLLTIAKHPTAVVTAKTVTLFVVSVGLYFLLDTTYMEKHLAYKFSFLFIPLWQWTMLVVSGFVIYLSNDTERRK